MLSCHNSQATQSIWFTCGQHKGECKCNTYDDAQCDLWVWQSWPWLSLFHVLSCYSSTDMRAFYTVAKTWRIRRGSPWPQRMSRGWHCICRIEPWRAIRRRTKTAWDHFSFISFPVISTQFRMHRTRLVHHFSQFPVLQSQRHKRSDR